MLKYDWPVSMLEGYGVPEETLQFIDGYVRDSDKRGFDLVELHKAHELLQETYAKQERYIVELEKQLRLLQKTLELIDANRGGENG